MWLGIGDGSRSWRAHRVRDVGAQSVALQRPRRQVRLHHSNHNLAERHLVILDCSGRWDRIGINRPQLTKKSRKGGMPCGGSVVHCALELASTDSESELIAHGFHERKCVWMCRKGEQVGGRQEILAVRGGD
jgi:hypothetical protein